MVDETLTPDTILNYLVESSKNLKITESEIWADIDAVFTHPPREAGDIDVDQLMARYGLSRNGAMSRMEILSRKGWEILTVADDTSASGKRKVIRRVK